MKKLPSDTLAEAMSKSLENIKDKEVKKVCKAMFKVTKMPSCEDDLCSKCQTRLNTICHMPMMPPTFECPKCGHTEGFYAHMGKMLFAVDELPQSKSVGYYAGETKTNFEKTSKENK